MVRGVQGSWPLACIWVEGQSSRSVWVSIECISLQRFQKDFKQPGTVR